VVSKHCHFTNTDCWPETCMFVWSSSVVAEFLSQRLQQMTARRRALYDQTTHGSIFSHMLCHSSRTPFVSYECVAGGLTIRDVLVMIFLTNGHRSELQGRSDGGGISVYIPFQNQTRQTFYGVTTTSERLLNLFHNENLYSSPMVEK